MTKVIYALGAAVVVTSTIVVAAQHQADPHQRPAGGHEFQALHSMCAAGGAAEGQTSHVPAHLAEKLQLTADQSAQIDKIAAEACSVIERVHTQIRDVLTPEQRARLAELHGGGTGHGAIGDFFKRLHGGK
ncbi:MAG TPA: hypothetical protein VFO19_08910 [Vicinamibacterales bacterium]|nr:hypothetical protein [Vicinamibacterales bacterium]